MVSVRTATPLQMTVLFQFPLVALHQSQSTTKGYRGPCQQTLSYRALNFDGTPSIE